MLKRVEDLTSFSGKTDKKLWTAPVVEAMPVHDALGAAVGDKCDRYGSLSKGTGCP